MSNLDVADMEHILSLPHGMDCAANQVLYHSRLPHTRYVWRDGD